MARRAAPLDDASMDSQDRPTIRRQCVADHPLWFFTESPLASGAHTTLSSRVVRSMTEEWFGICGAAGLTDGVVVTARRINGHEEPWHLKFDHFDYTGGGLIASVQMAPTTRSVHRNRPDVAVTWFRPVPNRELRVGDVVAIDVVNQSLNSAAFRAIMAATIGENRRSDG